MDYPQARLYISNALRFGWKLGLDRIQALMRLLDDPQTQLRCYHIAGTNGKGSVSAYTASILASEGYKVGLFTSPYIERFTERIRVIDGKDGLAALSRSESHGEISETDFACHITRVAEAVETMKRLGMESPTEFELITAAAFLHFAQTGCDRVVLETGLGGRLDSTNVITRSEASVITALGYDHMDKLGDTLPEIAYEKAGIIKSGCPVYLFDPHVACDDSTESNAVEAVFIDRCSELGSPLTVLKTDWIDRQTYTPDGQDFTVRMNDTVLALATSMLGLYQPMNAALAALATWQDVSRASVEAGIAATRWLVRQEIIRRTPPEVLIDGSHNLQSVQALSETLDRIFPDRDIFFVCGVMSDKDHEEMLRAVLLGHRYMPVAFYAVTPDNPRALPAEELAREAESVLDKAYLMKPDAGGYNRCNVHRVDDPVSAAAEAVQAAGSRHGVVCVFGSLYMVGEVRSYLRQRQGPDSGPERTP